MLNDITNDQQDADTIEDEAARDKPSWATVARRVIPPTAGAITLVAAFEALTQPFTRSNLALIGFSLIGAACVIAIIVIGSIIWVNRNQEIKIRIWVAFTVFICCTVVGVTLVAWPSSDASVHHPTTKKAAASPSSTSVPGSSDKGATPAAVAQATVKLDSEQIGIRLGGISELQRIMRTNPKDQPAAIEALCKFIVKNSPATDSDVSVQIDIQAAITVLTDRTPANDGGAVIDLDNVNLTGADLADIDLSGASLSGSNGADLTDAILTNADLQGADLANSYFGGANLAGANLADTNLSGASFYQTPLCSGSNAPIHPAENYNCDN